MAQRVLAPTINTDFVRKIPLFSGLPESEKNALLKDGSIYSYRRKEHLFRHGDSVDHFHVICNGTVRLYHETFDGCEVTTDIRIAGDTICKTGIFRSFEKHHCHAEVVHDATIMEFPRQWLIDIAAQYSVVSSNLLSALSQSTHEMKVDAENRAAMSIEQRVACFLSKICAIQELNPSGFNLPYSKGLIASRLGMRQETLSRALLKLEDTGITVKDKHVSLHDLESIDKNVCSQCPGAESCFARKALRTKH